MIDLLIAKRKEVGVPDKNNHIFASITSKLMKSIRGNDALRWAVLSCKLVQPETVTATNLRKHIATLSQLLDLSENDLDMLATFLGHNINIHREYYRLPDKTLQIARCSKVLMMMEDGPGKYYGKSLDEIQISPDGMYKI